MFIERLIFNRLTDGLQKYIDDPRLYKAFLIDGGLLEEEAEEARRYFAGDATVDPPIEAKPPHPIMGYARPGGPFPAWAVTLGNESTVQDYLGEDGSGRGLDGEVLIDFETGEPIDAKVRRWEHRYGIITYTDHPDVALYYYELCKYIMVSGRSVFQLADLDEITYQGAEIAPDARYLPPDVFARQFSVQLRSDFEYQDELPEVSEEREEELGGTPTLGADVGRRVDIAVDYDDKPSDNLTAEQVAAIEAIRAGVTTYFVGDDDD